MARLPQGIETVMDPRGKGVSTGERQRICIARLLLRESPIMILDEPESNLDYLCFLPAAPLAIPPEVNPNDIFADNLP